MQVDLGIYGPGFVKWWRSIQPVWRHIAEGPLSRAEPQGDDNWTTLAKGSTSGIYVVVMALSWWLRALDPVNTTSDVWVNVGDVNWALQCMRYEISRSLKRERDEEQPQGTTKWVNIVFHLMHV